MNKPLFLAILGVALALVACTALTVGDVQAFRLFFTLDEDLAEGVEVEAHSSGYE